MRRAARPRLTSVHAFRRRSATNVVQIKSASTEDMYQALRNRKAQSSQHAPFSRMKWEKLEGFACVNGAKHYECEINKEKIKLRKSHIPVSFKNSLKFGNKEIIIFEPDFPVFWEVLT